MKRSRRVEAKNRSVTRYTRAVPMRRVMRGVPMGRRARGVERRDPPFVPPEDWHEPQADHQGYRIVVQDPGPGFRHILTPDEIHRRLAQLPAQMVEPLQVVQLSRMTRKKCTAPCYGMQWGPSIYLYPIEESLVETFSKPPSPAQRIEAKMFGGRWRQYGSTWKLHWTEAAVKDFYLNNVLIHELGHLLDSRNGGYTDRERYAEWFAIEYGYRRSSRLARRRKPAKRRHHSL